MLLFVCGGLAYMGGHENRGPVGTGSAGIPPSYRERVFERIAPYFDALFASFFFFLGGQRRVRQGLVEFAAVRPGEHALDLACGTGALTLIIAEQVGPGGLAVGIDLSAAMVAVAARKTKGKPWVSFRQAMAERLPFPDQSFDKVFASYALHEMPEASREGAISEAYRVLKPGGALIVLDFSLPERWAARVVMTGFVRLVEDQPARDMLVKGSLLPAVERLGFHIVQLKYLFQGASVMVKAVREP